MRRPAPSLAAIVHEELAAAEVRILARVAELVALLGGRGDTVGNPAVTAPKPSRALPKPSRFRGRVQSPPLRGEAIEAYRARVLAAIPRGRKVRLRDLRAKLGPDGEDRKRLGRALAALVDAGELRREGDAPQLVTYQRTT